MFAFLKGTVTAKALDHIALDVGGVGYRVQAPDSTHRKLLPHQEVTLITYCHIRENAFDIFGFLKEEEKTLFTLLLGISGVGPKVAIAVLSGLSVAEFGHAVLESDVAAFTKIAGVGKKMAQRIVLEMKSKMGQDSELSAILGEQSEAMSPKGDVVYEALVSLGCTPAEAKQAAAGARKELGDDDVDEELVRAALRSMARTR